MAAMPAWFTSANSEKPSKSCFISASSYVGVR